jgi:transitional endoplasmic reticulum ATPase
VDGILNTLDGVGTKESEIITILTTNHVDNINKAMLRPGRLDAVLTVTPPDGPTAVKLARQYARGLLDDSNALELAGQEMAGMIPAVIREVVERSKLWAIGRAGGDLSKLALTADDLVGAAQGMQDHLTLLAEEQKVPQDTLESKILEVVEGATIECVSEKLDELVDRE